MVSVVDYNKYVIEFETETFGNSRFKEREVYFKNLAKRSKKKEENKLKCNNYDFVNKYFDDMAMVCKNNKWGYINNEGKEVIPCIYDEIVRIDTKLFRVGKNGEYSFLNEFGEPIYAIYDEIIYVEDELEFKSKFSEKGILNLDKTYMSAINLGDKLIYIEAKSEVSLARKKLELMHLIKEYLEEKVKKQMDELENTVSDNLNDNYQKILK